MVQAIRGHGPLVRGCNGAGNSRAWPARTECNGAGNSRAWPARTGVMVQAIRGHGPLVRSVMVQAIRGHGPLVRGVMVPAIADLHVWTYVAGYCGISISVIVLCVCSELVIIKLFYQTTRSEVANEIIWTGCCSHWRGRWYWSCNSISLC